MDTQLVPGTGIEPVSEAYEASDLPLVHPVLISRIQSVLVLRLTPPLVECMRLRTR